MSIKRTLFIAALLLSCSVAQAKENPEKSSNFLLENAYINILGATNFNINSEIELDYWGAGYTFQAGYWLSPYFAIQGNFAQTFKNNSSVSNSSIDFLWNLSNSVNYKENRTFSLVLFTGADAMLLNIGNDRTWYPTLDLGGQLQFRLNKALNIIAEVRGGIGIDDGAGRIPLTNILSAKVGLSCNLRAMKRTKPRRSRSKHSDDIVVESTPSTQSELAEQRAIESEFKSVELAQTPIFFNPEQDVVAQRDIDTLEYIAKVMRANPDVTYIIEGYADYQIENSLFNHVISERRAEVVANILIENGVNKRQLKVVGGGDIDNLNSNNKHCVIIKAE